MQAAVCAGIGVGGTEYYVYENEERGVCQTRRTTSAGNGVGKANVGARAMTKTSHTQDTEKFVVCSAATGEEDAIDWEKVWVSVLLVCCRS
jgi:hypothetical protein